MACTWSSSGAVGWLLPCRVRGLSLPHAWQAPPIALEHLESEIMRDLAQQLGRSHQAVRATIARDLESQGATPYQIRDSLEGFDQLFAESLRCGLAEFAR